MRNSNYNSFLLISSLFRILTAKMELKTTSQMVAILDEHPPESSPSLMMVGVVTCSHQGSSATNSSLSFFGPSKTSVQLMK